MRGKQKLPSHVFECSKTLLYFFINLHTVHKSMLSLLVMITTVQAYNTSIFFKHCTQNFPFTVYILRWPQQHVHQFQTFTSSMARSNNAKNCYQFLTQSGTVFVFFLFYQHSTKIFNDKQTATVHNSLVHKVVVLRYIPFNKKKTMDLIKINTGLKIS